MTKPGNDVQTPISLMTEQSGCWYKPRRCSICTRFIWLYYLTFKEPVGAPEPRQEWALCKPCQQALFMEMGRSSIRSPLRLRIAMGLVAAERSPHAHLSTPLREQQVFQREFSWFVWLLVLFGILHLVIFVIIFTVHK